MGLPDAGFSKVLKYRPDQFFYDQEIIWEKTIKRGEKPLRRYRLCQTAY